MKLSQEEKDIISQEIGNLEKYSSAELVAVVAKRSEDYKYANSLLGIFFTFLFSFFLYFSSDFSNLELIQYQILIFLFIFLFLQKFEIFTTKLLPKIYKHHIASKNAKNQFHNLGLNKTKHSIMFFVSIEEKYVEIICDKEITKKIGNEYWQHIVDEFINDVKNNHLSNGYLKAIQACSDILIKKFPIKRNDINEFSNDVITLS